MEWNLEAPCWDSENIGMVSNKSENHAMGLQELGDEAQQSIGSVVEHYGREGQKNQVDCFVDLKLGRLGDFGNGYRRRDHSEATVSPTVLPGSSRRSRAVNGSNQAVLCLVEGCTSDFSSCKDYHKKHKVCDIHSKTPKVTVDGREQRFCQQCSRFHLLAEFDEGKRSCRTRLDGHNKRRRKQQPDFLSRNSGSLFTNFQGAKFSTHINPQLFPTTIQEPSWTGTIKAEEDGIYSCYPPLSLAGTTPFSYKEGKQFPFLHTIASSGTSSQTFADGLTTRVFDSDCALSLLSSPSQPPVINLGNTVQDDWVSIAQPLIQGMKYSGQARFSSDKLLSVACRSQGSNSMSSSGFSCSGMEDEQVSAVLVSDASDADLRCSGIVHVADVGRSESGPMQTPPFSWH